jgi:hypothetical protein
MKWSRGPPVSCTGRLTVPTGHLVSRAHAISPVTTGDPPSAPPCRLHRLPRSSPDHLNFTRGLRGELLNSFAFSHHAHHLCCATCCHSAASGATADALPSRIRAQRIPDVEWTSASSYAAARSRLKRVGRLLLHPPSASTWTGHSGHPLAPSPPPRALQPLCGPHRPPRQLPLPLVHPYHRRSPPPTHATADGLTGEHPTSPLPPNGSPTSLCRSSRRPRPARGHGAASPVSVRPWPTRPWVACQLSWADRIGSRVNSSPCSFQMDLFESISNLVQTK